MAMTILLVMLIKMMRKSVLMLKLKLKLK